VESSKIGAFALEQKLGGPGSCVYRAMHLQQRRPVVLKLIKIPFAATDALRTEFSDEMHLLKKLAHASAAKCFGGKIEGQQAYFAAELVEGETLAALVSRRGRLAWEQAVDLAEGICQGLQAAHELGLHHHDLVPDKIMVTPDGRAKVLDFRKDRGNNPLCPSARKRTPERLAFQAPEQILGKSPAAPADLYSLGCLLFFMLTGQPPFAGDAEEIGRQQQHETPPRISALVLDCPVWMDALVGQLLRKEPLERPHSATAVLLALQETRKRAATGAGVTQHALGGISSLKIDVDKDEVRRLVGRKAGSAARYESPDDETPFYERTWFVATAMSLALVGFIAFMTWILWPLSPEQMIARADELMAADDTGQRLEAEQDYLLPLIERYPDTDFARRAQEHLDVIEMHRTDTALKRRKKLGKDPENETARLYLEALELEESGEPAEARKKLQSLVDVIKPEGDDRLYILLARRELNRLQDVVAQSAGERETFINEKLAQVDALQKEGNIDEARKILTGIVSLYGENSEYADLVVKVQQRLDELSPAPEQPGEE
jgi:tetratricopeptide (TPR) repeat protein